MRRKSRHFNDRKEGILRCFNFLYEFNGMFANNINVSGKKYLLVLTAFMHLSSGIVYFIIAQSRRKRKLFFYLNTYKAKKV